MQCERHQSDIDLINTEISRATEMVNTATGELLKEEHKEYYENLFAQSLRDQGTAFSNKIGHIYNWLGQIPVPTQKDYEVIVTCNNTTPFCTRGFFAHISDGKKKMNLCDTWFDNSIVAATADAITDCQSGSPTFRSLKDFRMTKCRHDPPHAA